MAEYLDLTDDLLIAESVLGVAAETIARWPEIGLAESALHVPELGFGGVEFYPDLVDKAAVLYVRLARNHPSQDGNKRVAYLALVEFLARNDIEWRPPSTDETVSTIEGVAAGEVSEQELAEAPKDAAVGTHLDPGTSFRICPAPRPPNIKGGRGGGRAAHPRVRARFAMSQAPVSHPASGLSSEKCPRLRWRGRSLRHR